MSRPRLLIVGGFPPADSTIVGGIVTSCRALLDSSFAQHFELTLLDSTQRSHPPPGLMVRSVLAARRLVAFAAKLVAGRPDAVLLFASVGGSLVEKGLMAWLTRLAGRPALLFPRGGVVIDSARRSARSRAWIRAAFGGARVVLCQGPAWQRFAVEVLHLSRERAPIVPNWTASRRLLSIGQARPPRADGDPPRLLFLGWLEADKGVFELLEACRVLAPQLDFTLTLVGSGRAEPEARRFVSEKGLQACVHFAGWLQGADLEAQLANHDVLVLPSWEEGLPNAMIEAMAAGLAVVASAVGNIPDVVGNEREALLVPPRDVPALSAAMRRVLTDAALRGRLQLAGHALAATQFAVEPAMQKLATIVLDTARTR